MCLSVPRVSVGTPRKEISQITLFFVNISLTLVFDTSMERSSRVASTARKLKNFISLKKSLKLNFDLCLRAEITLASSISVLH